MVAQLDRLFFNPRDTGTPQPPPVRFGVVAIAVGNCAFTVHARLESKMESTALDAHYDGGAPSIA